MKHRAPVNMITREGIERIASKHCKGEWRDHKFYEKGYIQTTIKELDEEVVKIFKWISQ